MVGPGTLAHGVLYPKIVVMFRLFSSLESKLCSEWKLCITIVS